MDVEAGKYTDDSCTGCEVIERTLSKEPKVAVEKLIVNLSLRREYRTFRNAFQRELASVLGRVWKLARK